MPQKRDSSHCLFSLKVHRDRRNPYSYRKFQPLAFPPNHSCLNEVMMTSAGIHLIPVILPSNDRTKASGDCERKAMFVLFISALEPRFPPPKKTPFLRWTYILLTQSLGSSPLSRTFHTISQPRGSFNPPPKRRRVAHGIGPSQSSPFYLSHQTLYKEVSKPDFSP